MDVVEQRQAALTKKYNGLVWMHFKSLFKLPQILGTLSAIWIISWVLTNLAGMYLVFRLLFAIIMILFRRIDCHANQK